MDKQDLREGDEGGEVELPPGEFIVMPSSNVDDQMFEDLMKFQYGEGDESDQAFERIKKRAEHGGSGSQHPSHS